MSIRRCMYGCPMHAERTDQSLRLTPHLPTVHEVLPQMSMLDRPCIDGRRQHHICLRVVHKCDIGIDESPGMDPQLTTPVRRVQLTNRDATEPGQPVQRQRDVRRPAQHHMQRSTTCDTASYATQHSRDTASNAVQHHVRHDIECYPDEQLS